MTVANVFDFNARKATGDRHEKRVRDELERRDWTVDQYGQGVLSKEITSVLGRGDSRLRWDPDFIVARGSTLYLVDAKASMRGENAHMYKISRKALQAHRRLTAEVDYPLVYVFSNLGVATPDEVMKFCGISTIGEAAGYVSFPAGLAHPFDDTFGPLDYLFGATFGQAA